MNITTRSMSKKGNRKFVALDSEDEDEDPDFHLADVAEATSEETSREPSDVEDEEEDFSDSMDDFIVEDSGDSDYDFEEEIALKYLDSKKKSIKIIDSPKNDDNVILTRNLQVPKIVSEEKKLRDRSPRKRFSLPMLPQHRPSLDYLNTLDDEERKKIEELEKQINQMNKCDIPLKYKILQSELEISEKARIIKTIENSNENSGEYNKISHYVNTVLSIPFNRYKSIDVKTKTVNNFILEASNVLENIIYGHENAKLEILQILTQMISNPKCGGQIIGIHGPAGIGKTTLIKEGLAKVLDRPFAFVSLGGCGDSSYLDGHSFTYEGSKSGCIVDILTKTNCMNPVIYFDELDKVSDTPKGEEIINLLIHLTDFSQNDHFNDKYYNNIPIDLSKALFIFSLNDLTKVNPILRDRMFMIQTSKLTAEEKLTISKDYLIDGIFNDMGVDKEELIFSDEIIQYIVKNYSQEEGVRNLKRAFQTIIGKLNIIRITQQGSLENLDLPFKLDNFELPMNITEDIVKKLVESDKLDYMEPPEFMYT